MVEVDGVAEVDVLQLVEGGGRVFEGASRSMPAMTGASSSTDTPVWGRSVVAILAATRATPSVTERR